MRKLLLVDDDVELCAEFAALLRDEGYDVENTSDSSLGAALIRKNKHNLYIFDYKMKGLNGIDLLRIAKEVNHQAIVFIVSGRSSIESLIVSENVAHLVTGVIKKPFKIEDLLKQIGATE